MLATLNTNATLDVSFDVIGGTNTWLPFDVLGTTNLIGVTNLAITTTNSAWIWLTNTYTCQTVILTNQPAGQRFYVIRPPIDVQVNDPAQDYGTDKNTQFETT